jgi:hypothetical protein
MEQNPYEVLNVDPAPLSNVTNSSNWFTVEGDLLVCGAFVILPEICVFTGATEDLVVRTAVAQYPSFRLVIFRRECRIQYYLTQAEDSKRRRISFLTTGGIIFGLMLMFASIPTGMYVLLAIGPILSLILWFVKFLLNAAVGLNLCIAGFKAPRTYRIRGFPMPFLATLAATRRTLREGLLEQ